MRTIGVMLFLALSVGLAALDTSIERDQPYPKKKGDSVMITLAGEFRAVFANLLWIKAERYHHEYIARDKDWTKNTDLMGLNRIITKLDPHFEEAYATGSRMLIGEGKLKEAQAYLEEAVTANPNSMMLHDEYGTMLARHIKDYPGALFHLKRAYLLATDDWDRRRLGRLIRTVEGSNE